MSLLSNFQDIVTAVKLGLSKKVDQKELDTALNLKADKTTVNALDTRVTQVNQLVNNINSFTVSIVSDLAGISEPASNVIYFVPSEDEESGNIYNEYMYIDSNWELIGTTSVDLSDYSTTSAMQTWVNSQGFAKSANLAEVASTGAYSSLSGAPSASDVASNTSARHTHSNKSVLDKFSEVSGELQYDGSSVNPNNLLIVSATFTGTISGGYTGTLDKTNIEILEAYEKGMSIWIGFDNGFDTVAYVPISAVIDDGISTYQEITFSRIFITGDGDIRQYFARINGTTGETNAFSFYDTYPDYSKGGSFYVGDTAPQDTSLLWIDTSDNSVDNIYIGDPSNPSIIAVPDGNGGTY